MLDNDVDIAKREALISAGNKLITILVAFWQRLNQAATAKEPLAVYVHNWAAAKMSMSDADALLSDVSEKTRIGTTNAGLASDCLIHSACLVLIDLTCSGAFTTGSEDNLAV